MPSIKNFVKKHERLKRAALLLMGRKSIKKKGFHTTAEAVDLIILALKKKVPNNFDCIVGIPRAGLLFANILASTYGTPLATPEGFVRGEIWFAHEIKVARMHRVLVVEDSVVTGSQLQKAKDLLTGFDSSLEVETLAIFKTKSDYKCPVTYSLVNHDSWTLAEWNLLTSLGFIGKLAVDMDGVICEDCPPESDDDSSRYLKWMSSAKPLLIPRFEIEAIVTSRLEKYRQQTMKWLLENNIKYKKLIMLNLPSKEDRTYKTVVDFKVSNIKKIGPYWFWESNLNEAKEIALACHIPVLCTADMQVF